MSWCLYENEIIHNYYTMRKGLDMRWKIANKVYIIPSLETQGQLVGVGKSLKRQENNLGEEK